MFLAEKLLKPPSGGATDPYFYDVSLLLTGDGTNGAQNNTFLDSSTNNFTITRNGNTTQGSFSPYGSLWSNYFNSTSNGGISLSDNAVFQVGTGDFTVEFWMNQDSLPTSERRWWSYQDAGGTVFNIYQETNGKINVELRGNGSVNDNTMAGTIATAIGTWYHVAVTRASGTLRLFINGVLDTSATSQTQNITAGTPGIGFQPPSSNAVWPSYISNFRFTKGGALYTSAFTPSTVPLTTTVSAGTVSLLTCQSNRFVDNSVNNFALTVTSSVCSVQRFSPFNPTSAYSTSVIGGSGYFRGGGSGDSLVTPSITVGTNPFCFECWVYPTVAQNNPLGPGLFSATTSNGLQCSYYNNTGLGIAQKGVAWQVTENTIVPTVGAWNHIAFVRSGTGTNQTSIFLNGVRVANGTVSYSYAAAAYSVSIVDADFTEFYGYIANCRFTNGSTPYDATLTTLTVPTAPLTTSASNTVLLLNMTNAGIPDNAMMNDLQTVGNAQISTSVKKYGTGSMAFDGTGDYLFIPQSGNTQNINWELNSGDFTIEFWFYANTISPTTQGMVAKFNGNAGARTDIEYLISLSSGGNLNCNLYQSTTNNDIVFTSSISTSTWYHVALVRSGTSVYAFLNGVKNATTRTISGTLNSGTSWPLYIGRYTEGGVNYDFNGYIDDLRITKGYARYTTNFTPPTAALPLY